MWWWRNKTEHAVLPCVAGVSDRRHRIGIPVFATRHYDSALIEAARSRAAARWFGEHERS